MRAPSQTLTGWKVTRGRVHCGSALRSSPVNRPGRGLRSVCLPEVPACGSLRLRGGGLLGGSAATGTGWVHAEICIGTVSSGTAEVEEKTFVWRDWEGGALSSEGGAVTDCGEGKRGM